MSLTTSSHLDKKVFEYSRIGHMSVSADLEKDIGIVYVNGQQIGFCVANPDYSMFGIEIGKVRYGMEDRMTYSYDDAFEIDEDIDRSIESGRRDFPVFYCNWANNDCLVVSCDKATGNVTALTYYSDVDKVTERLAVGKLKK